jgi:hypothetical protein
VHFVAENMSDDGDGADEGSQSRPEPQLVRSPPVFRKQQRTPLGKTNYFRLTKAEEDAKKRASLEASREMAVTNSQLMEYSMNSIEQARQLASRNGRAELGTRGRYDILVFNTAFLGDIFMRCFCLTERSAS